MWYNVYMMRDDLQKGSSKMFRLNRWKVYIAKGNSSVSRNFMFYFVAYIYACLVTGCRLQMHKSNPDVYQNTHTAMKIGSFMVRIYRDEPNYL